MQVLSKRAGLFKYSIKQMSQKSQKWFFWSNPYKIEVKITSLIQMLELPNFGHVTTSIIYLSHMTKFRWWCHRQNI